MIEASVVPGEVFQVIVSALLRVYDEDDLKQLLRFELELELDDEVGPGSLKSRVYELVDLLDRRGRVDELLDAAVAQHRNLVALRAAQEALRAARRAAAQGLAGGSRPVQPPPQLGQGDWLTADPLAVAEWGSRLREAARCVAVVETGELTSTGFLIAPRLLVTAGPLAAALRETPDRAVDVGVLFDFDSDALRGGTDGGGPLGEHYRLDQHGLVAVHPDHDVAVLLVGAREGPPEQRTSQGDGTAAAMAGVVGTRPAHLTLHRTAPPQGALLSLLSHAWRRPVQLEAAVAQASEGVLRRYTLGEQERPNAEGAPVCTAEFGVAAVHLGQEADDEGALVGRGLAIGAITGLAQVQLALAMSRAPMSARLAMAAR